MVTRRQRATDLLGFGDAGGGRRTPAQEMEYEACRESFSHFLTHWTFTNRETGEVMRFASLWPGQVKFAELMERESWIYALKAGKLGFTELECAFDAWVALFRQRNARVHIFSRDANAARELLGYVRFGIRHLPGWLRPRFAAEGNTQTTIRLEMGLDDVRSIVSYASGPTVSIDQSAAHCHVDELAHMPHPEETWSAVETTVAPAGSCHIVTRGHGDANYAATLWNQAADGVSRLHPFFAPYTERPGRDEAWREEHAGNTSSQAVLFFAPETAEDALAGDETAIYIPPDVWRLCRDPSLPPLHPGDGARLVIGVDAAVTGDCFAVVAVSRHPANNDIPAIREAKVWRPQDFPGHRIDFSVPEDFLRVLISGGCPDQHPRSRPNERCEHCRHGRFPIPASNVVQVCYDAYQMEAVAQRMQREEGAWFEEFGQTADRAKADAAMLSRALRGELKHAGIPALDQHIANCRAKLSKTDDSQLRIVKAAPNRKVDAAVAASMAVDRCMYLRI